MKNKRRFSKKDIVYKEATINADSFDKRRFNELLFMSNGLQKLKDEGKAHPYFDQLMGDIWSAFYKYHPRLLDEFNPNLILNHQLMKRLINDEQYNESHKFSRLDDLHSALSTIGFAEKIFKWFENLKSNDDLKQAYKDMMEQLQNYGDNSQQFQNAWEKYSETVAKYMESESSEFSKMLKDSIEQTKQTKEYLNALLGEGEGKSSGKELEEIPLKDQFELAEYLKNNPKMKKIAEWTGRFKSIARSKQKSISKESISRSGVTIGNDLDRILPSDLMLMKDPVAKYDFYRRFVEGQTLQFATKGKQALGKGSIILCLDQSGSMQELDIQSKGFTLALMSIAKRQKRDFALVTFSDKFITKQYPKGKISSKEMIDLCNHFIGGGTNFYSPLSESLKLIKGSRFKNADIVFVSDGEATLSQEFLNQFNRDKERLGFSVVSLLIGNSAKESTVRPFSDEIHHARDFRDKKAHEVFKI